MQRIRRKKKTSQRTGRILVYMLVFIFLISFQGNLANAATVHGTVYDISLKQVSNARVEIDTVPKQFMISPNGTYSFNAPSGKYSIKAILMKKRTITASALENITINQDGDYVLDLILFPEIEEDLEQPDIEISNDIIPGTSDKHAGNVLLIFIAALAILSILAAALYYKKLKRAGKKEEILISKAEEILKEIPEDMLQENSKYSEESDLEQVIKMLRREGGRTTQKEIRKAIPLSEAKISLMIAELEHKGAIEKIKKGRGNIIILKKK